MARIEVVKKAVDKGWELTVTVTEENGWTGHVVSLSKDVHERLTGGAISPEECVRRSFEFLLKREPKESILGSFELTVISRYFPEFEREISKSLP